ncbi:hypothetical protein AAC691_12310 [Nguyenibacter vanlangensis]|uniref:Uncharacterized protein n=1 Tax=Nguyenibacter vanlangensis TaxID=1216886 RepID=A0ABZ3D0I3_9PROT
MTRRDETSVEQIGDHHANDASTEQEAIKLRADVIIRNIDKRTARHIGEAASVNQSACPGSPEQAWIEDQGAIAGKNAPHGPTEPALRR